MVLAIDRFLCSRSKIKWLVSLTAETLLLLHSMLIFSAKKAPIPSVMRNWGPPYVVEIVGLSGSADGAQEGKIWADEFVKALKQDLGPKNVVRYTLPQLGS